MTFLKFSNEIAKKVKQALVDASVSIETIKKPYGNLVGLAVSKQGSDTMPLFHLEPMYKAFRDGMSMDSLVAEIALQTNRFFEEDPIVSQSLDWLLDYLSPPGKPTVLTVG